MNVLKNKSILQLLEMVKNEMEVMLNNTNDTYDNVEDIIEEVKSRLIEEEE